VKLRVRARAALRGAAQRCDNFGFGGNVQQLLFSTVSQLLISS